VALSLLSSRYAEMIVSATNTDKFYLVCVWQDQTSSAFIADVFYDRRGQAGRRKEYYRGSSRAAAALSAAKQWSAKQNEGYQAANLPKYLAKMLSARAGATITTGAAGPVRNYTPLSVSPVPVAPVGESTWRSALSEADYVPVSAIAVDPSVVRVFVNFDARGVAGLWGIEARPAGGHQTDPEALKSYAQILFAKLEHTTAPAVSEALFDGWLIKGSTPILVLSDVIEIDGIDVRNQPFSSRYLLVEQAISDLDAADQIAGEWQAQQMLSRDHKYSAKSGDIWLRKIGAAYEANPGNAILRLA